MKLARPAKLLGRFAFGVNLLYGGYTFTSELGNGDYSNATFTGLGMFYSSIATFGGVPGMLIAGPMVLVDSTIGLDNLYQHGVSMQLERSNRINQGDFSSIWYTPGRLMR